MVYPILRPVTLPGISVFHMSVAGGQLIVMAPWRSVAFFFKAGLWQDREEKSEVVKVIIPKHQHPRTMFGDVLFH